MPFFGLILYLISSLIRPGDWYAPLLGQRLDFFTILFALFTGIFSLDLSPLRSMFKSANGIFMVLYILAIIVSDVLAGDIEVLSFAVSYYGKLFMLFLVIVMFCNSMEKLKWFNVVIVILVAVTAIQGIQMAITGAGWAMEAQLWAGKYERIRWVGMYDGPNVYCMLLNFGIVPALHFLFRPWGRFLRMCCAVFIPIIGLAIYYTNSRGGFLTLVFIVICTIWFKGFREGKKFEMKKILIVSVVMSLLLIVAPSRLSEINDSEHSAAHRIDSWAEGIDMFKEKPVFGVGVGNWRKHHYLLAHNSFVQNLGELGFVGLFLWVGVIYSNAKALIRMLLSSGDPNERSILSILLTGLCGLLVSSVFLTTTEFDLWFILFGMISSIVHIKDFRLDFRMKDLCRIFGIEVAGIAATGIAIRLF